MYLNGKTRTSYIWHSTCLQPTCKFDIRFWEWRTGMSSPCSLWPTRRTWRKTDRWTTIYIDHSQLARSSSETYFVIITQVSRPECENMAKQLKTPFIECSAKNRMNVDQAFYELVRLIRKFQALERPIAPTTRTKEKSKPLCNLI